MVEEARLEELGAQLTHGRRILGMSRVVTWSRPVCPVSQAVRNVTPDASP
jgi:hypothetical protein